MKLSREFTKKEMVLLIILAALLLGLVYWRFVYVPTQDKIKAYDTSELEILYQAEEVRALKIQSMRDQMEEEAESGRGLIQPYSNQKNELNTLNQIFSSADEFKISFKTPVAEGDLVRRSVEIVFTAKSYEDAEKIVSDLDSCDSLCLISDLKMKAEDNGDVASGRIQGSLTVTFYETLYGANTTEGLEIAKPSEAEIEALRAQAGLTE
ncbi:MAG: hypothetical protein HUJ73_05965 [Eubacterium sp.]|nr:hypothetical protein [Eubacterium sp.]